MENKRIAVLVLFLMLIVAGFLFYFLAFTKEKITGHVVDTSMDSHGCLIHQGFTWNETEKSCVREWLSSNQSRYQVVDFSSCKIAGYPLKKLNISISEFFNITNMTYSSYSNYTNFTGMYCTTPSGKMYLQQIDSSASDINSTNINETNSTGFNETNVTSSNTTNLNKTVNTTKTYPNGTTENIVNGQIYYSIQNSS